MAAKKPGRPKKEDLSEERSLGIGKETLRGVWVVLLTVIALIFMLARFDMAGRVGEVLYNAFSTLFGIGYYLVPLSLVLWAVALFRSLEGRVSTWHSVGSLVFFISSLALLETLWGGSGGMLGSLLSYPLVTWLAVPATVLILLALIVSSLLIVFDASLHLPSFFTRTSQSDDELYDEITNELEHKPTKEMKIAAPLAQDDDKPADGGTPAKKKSMFSISNTMGDTKSADADIEVRAVSSGMYTPPPVSLLRKNSGKPGVGDVKANATIIKRTLQNFGIDVEMDEVSIGPTVTRYALKPAEGVRLGKIVGLQSNLELALAASPVRIEAPIPGKALVGIEVPNTARTMLGLGSLLTIPAYTDSEKPLLVALGGDISGEPHFANLAKMPHILIAGTTGAGKSVTINDFIVSLLYRCGPDQLRLLMVDPKRVELSLYNKIPHLLTPVITDAKKAILALKWLAKEMDRRYDVLEQEAVRDIESYHKNVLAPAQEKAKKQKNKDGTEEKLPEQMPYIVAFLDEISDLMQAYPRELEAAIVRLAQMSRAVGIHLVLSTQRPSVKVITGLIKANVPARIALQVASQIDSRTILDMGGAEKLLGAGDMLYLSGEMSKPVRVQAPYVSEKEVKAVVKHLRDAYESELDDEIALEESESDNTIFEASVFDSHSEEEDDLFEEAKQVVIEAGKASTSYLQRKLRVGYARAARLMDILEEHGVVGPAEGSKPREVLTGHASTQEEREHHD